jgi:endonuclease/exonuclease/phosphatase family metal-dependent hydrolase
MTRTLAAAAGTLLALLATACAATQPARTADRVTARITPITIDGDTTDWPGDTPVQVEADQHHLFIRFDPETGNHAIQAAPFTTRILIDADDRPGTGTPVAGLGVDLAVLLSPPNAVGSIGIGSEVMRYDRDGFGASIGHAEIGFFFLPSHASTTYEARIDRAALASVAGRPIRVRVEQVNADAQVLWSGEAEAELPAIDPGTAVPTADLPANPKDALRVLSLNVLHSAPLHNPDAFRRTLRAIDPDVILFQEWFNTPQTTIQTWMNTNAGPGWTVIAPNASKGVAVATRVPVLEVIPAPLADSGPGRNARFVAAVVEGPAGPTIVGSLHLKCCGGANSAEDIRRNEEAASINATLADALTRHPDAAMAIGGDYNLVGTRTPLETLAQGLDADGGDLEPVHALTLGDAAAVTWVDEKSRFSPARLDWILIDSQRSTIRRAFTLDTRRLTPAALQRLSLEPLDSQATDHLPIVVDLAR